MSNQQQQQQQQQQMNLPTMVEPFARSRNNSLGDISLDSLNDGASIGSSYGPEEQRVTQHLLPPQNNECASLQGGPVVVVMQGESDDVDLRTTPHALTPSGSNNLPSESPSSRPNSLSRRRSANKRNRPPSGFVPSPATASSSSTVTTASSSSLILQRANNSTRSETIDEEGQGGLRTSLDAGMAAVRRWIRSRSATTATPTTPSTTTTPSWTPSSSPRVPSADDFEDAHLLFLDQQDANTRNNFDDLQMLQQQEHQHSREHNRLAPPTNMEERLRQRALSEPDALRIRDFLYQRALSAPQRGFRRRRFPNSAPSSLSQSQQRARQRTRSDSIELISGEALQASPPSQLSSSAAEVLYSSARSLRSGSIDMPPDDGAEISTIEPSVQEEAGAHGNTIDNSAQPELNSDANREARARWIRINRRFQLVITVVALVFSLLLFAILVCWVVLTSAYVVSIDKSCDVPLKAYFWLVTLQLILDVFRTDIMRLFFRWDANSNQRIPCRVITYNIAYLTYALLVLRLGIISVLMDRGATCRRTAPELFQSSTAFVSLSIAAWSTIVLGYLVPFCFVATLLTWNGYTPSSDAHPHGAPNPFSVFPSVTGAPPGCVDQLRIVMLEDFPADYPMECCICMENFVGREEIVETECNHVFHKQCCREWLRQARTCPVCRMDIPDALEHADDGATEPNNRPPQRRGPSPRLGLGPAGRPFQRDGFQDEVASLLRILRRRDRRQNPEASSSQEAARDGSTNPRNQTLPTRNQTLPVTNIGEESSNLEEGRVGRQFQASS